MSLRAKAWQSPGTETRTLLAIDKRRICFRNHYRAENLRYQLKHGQKLPPQFRQIICLVKRTLCGDIEPIAQWYRNCVADKRSNNIAIEQSCDFIFSYFLMFLYRICTFLFIVVHNLYNVKHEASNRKKFKAIANRCKPHATTGCRCVGYFARQLYSVRKQYRKSRLWHTRCVGGLFRRYVGYPVQPRLNQNRTIRKTPAKRRCF